MIKPVLAAIALAITFAAAAPAQYAVAPLLTGEFKVTPRDAGTKKKPVNALVYTKGIVNEEAEATLRRLEYYVPSTIRIDGTGFRTCSADFINRNGDDACPRGSKVGTGGATALLGPQKTPLEFDIEIYAAGRRALTIYLQSSLFNIAFPGTIANGIVGFDIPERVQQPVPGLYAYVTTVTSRLGKQRGIPAAVTLPSGRKRFFVSTIGCRNGRHSGKVRAYLAPNPNPPFVEWVEIRKRSRCSR